jgi:hypothetical protein
LQREACNHPASHGLTNNMRSFDQKVIKKCAKIFERGVGWWFAVKTDDAQALV